MVLKRDGSSILVMIQVLQAAIRRRKGLPREKCELRITAESAETGAKTDKNLAVPASHGEARNAQEFAAFESHDKTSWHAGAASRGQANWIGDHTSGIWEKSPKP